jgi:threonine dehydratase
MSATLEYTPTSTKGDEAYSIISQYRHEMEDMTCVDELEAEFPYYCHQLGLKGVLFADLADNTSGTFKWRGSLVCGVDAQQRGAERLDAFSAGNHARGVVATAKALDMYTRVGVPSSAPRPKKEGIHDVWRSHKVEVVVAGRTLEETAEWAYKQKGGTLVHPYADPLVMAGQGTVVDDVLARAPETMHFVLPIGGAGLATGVRQRLDELGKNGITVHAAEAEGSNSMSKSVSNRRLMNADNPNKRFGGSAVLATSQLALNTFLSSTNINVLQVTNNDVDELSELYLEGREDLLRTNTPNFEPTSLVAVAALKQLRHLNGRVVVLGTGKNDTIYPNKPKSSRRLYI